MGKQEKVVVTNAQGVEVRVGFGAMKMLAKYKIFEKKVEVPKELQFPFITKKPEVKAEVKPEVKTVEVADVEVENVMASGSFDPMEEDIKAEEPKVEEPKKVVKKVVRRKKR